MSAPMMNHSRREKWMAGPSVKRKERDGNGNFDVKKPSPLTTKKLAKPSPHHRHPPPLSPNPSPKPTLKPSPNLSAQPLSKNNLLAGYLAHEYLSKGTLFGQPWDKALAESVPVSSRVKSSRKGDLEPEKYLRYKEVADLMKTDGAHIPGIVNPTQLARFLQLG